MSEVLAILLWVAMLFGIPASSYLGTQAVAPFNPAVIAFLAWAVAVSRSDSVRRDLEARIKKLEERR